MHLRSIHESEYEFCDSLKWPAYNVCLFFELLAYSQALGFTNTMATNATLIDDDVTRKLRRFGLAIAAMSLDGFTAEQHDMVRRISGSFEAAIREMRALRRAGIVLHVNITAME
ncbi:MAG TPA: radical SAM protein [archaeon]